MLNLYEREMENTLNFILEFPYLKPNFVKTRRIILWMFLLCVFMHILITFMKEEFLKNRLYLFYFTEVLYPK